MSIIDRVGALAGFVGVALLVAYVTLVDPTSELNPNPEASSKLVARALAENADSARAGVWCGLAAGFFLIVFFARLHGALRSAVGPDSWLPSVVLIGAAGFVATLLVDAGFSLAASEPSGYDKDTQVAMMILLFGWNSASLFAPCLTAVMAAGTAIAYLSHAFPTWLAWAGVALLLCVLALSASGAAGLATGPGLLWLLLMSVVLATHRAQTRPLGGEETNPAVPERRRDS